MVFFLSRLLWFCIYCFSLSWHVSGETMTWVFMKDIFSGCELFVNAFSGQTPPPSRLQIACKVHKVRENGGDDFIWQTTCYGRSWCPGKCLSLEALIGRAARIGTMGLCHKRAPLFPPSRLLPRPLRCCLDRGIVIGRVGPAGEGGGGGTWAHVRSDRLTQCRNTGWNERMKGM